MVKTVLGKSILSAGIAILVGAVGYRAWRPVPTRSIPAVKTVLAKYKIAPIPTTEQTIPPTANPSAAQDNRAAFSPAKATELSKEASALFVPDETPEVTDRRLQNLADNLNTTSAAEFLRVALNTKMSPDERYLATFVLGRRPKDFSRELQTIASRRPESARDTAAPIQAMLALEEGRTHSKVFTAILTAQRDPLLIKIAKLGALGARDGRPLIKNYVDLQMAEIIDASH